MKCTHSLLVLVLLLSGLALAQQNPPIAQPQPSQPAEPGLTQPVVPVVKADQDRTQIHELVQQLNQAAKINDTAFFDHVLSSDYQAVNAQGKKEDKGDILQAHRNHDIKYESIEQRDQDIQVNGNTATERTTADVRGVYKGARFDGAYLSTREFQRQPDGSWQIVSLVVNHVK